MVTMKMGMIIAKGTELEVKKEFKNLLEKAKVGFKDAVEEKSDLWFTVNLTDCRIGFNLEKSFGDEYAIYQIID